MDYLVDPGGDASLTDAPAAGATAGNAAAKLVNAFEAAVGMDEPPSEMA